MASLKGAVLGGYVLGFLTIGLQTWLPQGVNNYRDAIMFGIVIVVLLIRPDGIDPPAYSRECGRPGGSAAGDGRNAAAGADASGLVDSGSCSSPGWRSSRYSLSSVTDVVFERVVTVMFINLLLTVGLQIFMGNSGFGSFGQYAFVTIGAYCSIWFSLTPQQEKPWRCRTCRKDWWLYDQHLSVPASPS